MKKELKKIQLLNLNMIKAAATREKTYEDGLDYYLRGKVIGTRIDKKNKCLIGVVKGSSLYRQKIYFESHEMQKIVDYDCDCPASYAYKGLCKHSVAALIAYSDSSIGEREEEKTEKTDIDMLKSIIAPEISNSHKVKVSIKTVVSRFVNRYSDNASFKVHFMINEEGGREYKMQSIYRFAHYYKNGSNFEFAKKFTYTISKHKLSEPSRKLIDYIYEGNQGAYMYQLANKSESVLDERNMKLFFKVLYENKIPITYIDEYINIENTVIEKENLELDVILEKEADHIRLKYNKSRANSIIPIISDMSYYVYYDRATLNKKIWHVPQDREQKYEFFRYMSAHDGDVNLGDCKKEDIAVIVSNINRVATNFEVSKNLSEKIVNDKLMAYAYFDKYDEGIAVRLEYDYNAEKINPLVKQDSDKIIMRDINREKEIEKVIIHAGFEQKNEVYMLKDEDKIYDFVSQELPKIKEKADEVFYSDEFKGIKIKPKTSFSASTRLGDNGLLEISFDYGDINKNEIRDILSSFRKKKRYHRLKDGSFLNLDDENIREMQEIINDIDITDKKLLEEKIHMPIYRLMYLDSKLANLDNFYIDKDAHLKKLLSDIRNGAKLEHKVPDGVVEILREYQTEGYRWLKTLDEYQFGGILADDMGLGKTLQMIAFLLSVNSSKKQPNLIIAPTSLVYNWQSEFEKFAEGKFKIGIISGNKEERNMVLENYQSYDVLITSYPLIRRDGHMYEDKSFEYVILDEAQHIKNHTSITAKTIKIMNAKRRFALTGTPIENNLLELWSIFDFIIPGYLHSYNKFLTKYDRKIMKDEDVGVLEMLNKHISPFILRRLKKDVLKDLPDKIETKMITELTTEQKKLYVAELSKAKREISEEIKNEGFEKSKIKILAILTRLRQICCHPAVYCEGYNGGSGKLDLLNELVDEIVGRDGKALIFSQFTSVLALIQDELRKKGINYLYLDGSVKSSERLDLVNKFNDGDAKLFLISLKAGGTGLNLTGADTVIHFDPWWNPAVESQATDRAHRMGQKNVVQVMKIITKGTIEEKIYEMQQKKKELIDSVIKEGSSPITSLSEQDIYSLFE